MQPKFTQKNLGFVSIRIFALAMIIGLTTQFSLAQERQIRLQDRPISEKVTPQQQAEREQQKLERHNAQQLAISTSDNDAGLPNTVVALVNTNRTEAVCTTFVGSVSAADPNTSLRAFRDGAIKTCAAPGTCTAGLGGTFQYKILTWFNPVPQCVTVTYNNPGTVFGFVSVYSAPPDLTNTCTNWLGDPGGSATPRTFSFNAPAGTLYFLVTNVANGATTNFNIVVDAPVCFAAPCSGTPAPGNTISSVTTECPGTNFGLSLENPTAGSGVTYQWQSGPTATGPWTDIAGATNPSLTRNHTAATYYRCEVTCTTGPATTASNPVLVGLTPPSGCYCTTSTATSTADEDIFNVTLGTLNNSSTCASVGPGPGSVNRRYANYTSGTGAPAAPDVQAGAMSPFSVAIGTCNGNWRNSTAIWIDADQSGTFETSERVYVSPGTGSVGPHTESGNLVVPGNAVGGITRMRVVNVETGTPGNITPCGSYTWGETEDYNVNIIPCVPITSLTTLPNRTIQCSGSTTFTISANGTVNSIQWEYRMNSAAPWQFVTNGGIYSGATTATLSLNNVSQAFNGYEYRAVVTGGCSAIEFSNAAVLTVGPLIATVSPTSATICVGSVQQLSLTNTVSAPQTAMFSKTGLTTVLTNGVANIVVDSVNVTGIPPGSVINNIQWGFNMTHTWAEDVGSNITSPTGGNLNLVWQVGGSSDNFIGTYFDLLSTASIAAAAAPRTGVYAPMALAVSGAPYFNTTTTNKNDMKVGDLNGFWKFSFYDAFGGDDGLLTDLFVNITYTAPVFAQGTWTGPAGTMYTDAGATTLYTGTPATTIYVKPTATGVNNYNVSFTTPTPCTSATTTIPVTVHSAITGLASSPATRSVCLGNSTTFTASTTGGTPVSYQWQLSTDGGVTWANISGATSATLSVNNVTNAMNNNRYRVTVVNNVCGSYTSASSTLTVLALPVVTISAPDLALTPPQTTVITGASTPAAAANGWAWTLNGAGISGSTNTQNVNINTIGSYQATATDVNGCVNKSNILVIGSEASDRMWIYPNPTDGAFQVRLYYDSDVTERRRVTIYNMLGQVITSKHFTLADNTAPYLRMDFDLTNMQAGTYVVKVAHEFTGKVVSGLVIVQ